MAHIRRTADLDPQKEGAGDDREALLERRVLLEHEHQVGLRKHEQFRHLQVMRLFPGYEAFGTKSPF